MVSSVISQSEKSGSKSDTHLSQDAFNRKENDQEQQQRNSIDEEKGGEDQNEMGYRKVSLRERIKHFTWAWFTGTMSSGGISILLAQQPHRFRGLDTIGTITFIFHLTFFLTLCTVMLIRTTLYPTYVLHSLYHPIEAFYLPAFWLSIATIITCINEYAIRLGPLTHSTWLLTTLRVLFWTYAACTIASSWSQYWTFIRFSSTRSSSFSPNPVWFLPAYAVMLTGTVAGVVAPSQPPEHRVPILVAGVSYQGYGFMTSYLFLVMYTARLMQSGLPDRDQRPGLFFPVGLVGYTITALISLVDGIPRDYGYFSAHPSAVEILSAMALWIGIFLWVFGFFLFTMAVLGCLDVVPKMGFTLSWWAFVFPNVGFTLGTIHIGRQLESEGVLWVASGMSVVLVAVWLSTLGALVRAVWKGRIMWPGRDEDKEV